MHSDATALVEALRERQYTAIEVTEAFCHAAAVAQGLTNCLTEVFFDEALDRAAQKALERRRASGEILTYHLDGWVVQEHPGGRIERLAPIERFRAEDFPYPGFTPPRS